MNFDLLKNITSIYGPSSREDKIRNFILNEIKEYIDDYKIDNLGNLIAHKKGAGDKIMISAHMDQIGMMVIDIDKKGFIRFTNIGGVSPFHSIGQSIIFENGLKGLIYCEPLDDMSKLKLENMYIDIGTFSREETEKLVNIGDICIYNGDFIENDNVIFTPYLDDRVGCFIAIEAIKTIKNPSNDLYFVFSVQEEVGLRGATTAAYGIEPDLGISIDVTTVGDTPKARRLAVGLNKGTAIKIKDSSLLTHPLIKDSLMEISKEYDIKSQLEVLEFAGTDSGAIHTSKAGVPSGVISVPIRYVHSAVEMAAKEDINNSLELLIKFLEKTFK